MPKAIISDVARRDINQALKVSRKKHGVDARKRYRKLITASIKDIEENINKVGVEEWKPNVFRYHLRHSRDKCFIDGVRVKDPSHYLFFEETEEGKIRILRFLYETREFHVHL